MSVADLEANLAALERQRAEVAKEHQLLTRRVHTAPGVNRELSVALRANTDRGLELDRERGRAARELREARAKAARDRQWQAAHKVWGEHRELCGRALRLLDELLPVLEEERQIHERLEASAGASQLQRLYADLAALRQIRRRAALVADPPTETAA